MPQSSLLPYLKSFLFLALLLAIASACRSYSEGRYSAKGWTVVPPKGTELYKLEEGTEIGWRGSVQTKEGTEKIVFRVLTFARKPNETAEQLTKEWAGSIPESLAKELSIVSFDHRLDPSMSVECERFTSMRSRKVEGSDLPDVFANSGMVCLHPFWKNVAIAADYYSQYKQGDQPVPIEQEGEAFLRSIRLTRPSQ